MKFHQKASYEGYLAKKKVFE